MLVPHLCSLGAKSYCIPPKPLSERIFHLFPWAEFPSSREGACLGHSVERFPAFRAFPSPPGWLVPAFDQNAVERIDFYDVLNFSFATLNAFSFFWVCPDSSPTPRRSRSDKRPPSALCMGVISRKMTMVHPTTLSLSPFPQFTFGYALILLISL